MEGQLELPSASAPQDGELSLIVKYRFDERTAQIVGEHYPAVVGWGYFEIAVLGNHEKDLYLYYPMELDGKTYWFGVTARYDWDNTVIHLTIKAVDGKWAIPREERAEALREAQEQSWYFTRQ
jgi:hypothetical protein